MSSLIPAGHIQTVPGTASCCWSRPSAATPNMQTAPQHDDHLRVARLDFAEIAFRMSPAFGSSPFHPRSRLVPSRVPVVYFARPIPAGHAWNLREVWS